MSAQGADGPVACGWQGPRPCRVRPIFVQHRKLPSARFGRARHAHASDGPSCATGSESGEEYSHLLGRHRPGGRLHARRDAQQRLQAVSRHPRLARHLDRPEPADRVLRRRPRLARVRASHQDQVVAPHLQLSGPDDGPRHHAEHHRLLCRDHPRLAAGRPHLPVRLQPRRLHGALRRRRAEILRRADCRRVRDVGADQAAAARSQVGAAHRHRGRQARLPARQLGQARSPSRRARSARPPLPRQVLLRRHGDIQHHALLHRRVGHGGNARRRIGRAFPAGRRLSGVPPPRPRVCSRSRSAGRFSRS